MSLGFVAGGSLTGIPWCPGEDWGKTLTPWGCLCWGARGGPRPGHCHGKNLSRELSARGRCPGLGRLSLFREGELCPLCCCQGVGCSLGQFKPPLESCIKLYQGVLLSYTCKTNDKVHPSVTVGSWQQKGQVAKLGPVWLRSEPGVSPWFELSSHLGWTLAVPHCGFTGKCVPRHREALPWSWPEAGWLLQQEIHGVLLHFPPPRPGASSDALEKCPCDVRLELGWTWHPSADDPDSGQGRVALDPSNVTRLASEMLNY